MGGVIGLYILIFDLEGMKKRKGPQSDKYMMTMLECIIKRKNKAIIQVTRKPQLIFNCKKGDLLLSWPLSLRSIVA